MKPILNGDTFARVSTNNTLFGDFLTAFAFYTHDSSNAFVIEDNANTFATFQNAKWAQSLSPDVFNVTGDVFVDGQKGKDVIEGDTEKNSKAG